MKLFIIALMVLAISAHSTYEDPPDMDLLQQEDWNQQYNPGAVDKAAVAGEALSDLVDQDVYSSDTVKKMTRAEHEIAAGMLTEVVKEKKAAEVEKHSVEHPQQVAALMLGERISDKAFVHEADQPRSDESPEEAAAIAKRIVEEAPKDVEGLEDDLEVKKKRSTVTNLMNFKAFCMGAKEKADDVLDSWDGGKGGSMSALLPFIIAYGKPSKHPFIDYAKQIAKYKAKYPMGISRYVITNLHNSIVNGAGVVDVNKPVGFCSLRHQAFGLTARPYMLRKVLTTLTKFSELKQKAQKALSGADAKAAAAWLKSGAKTKFKTFKARVEDYYKAKVHECYRKTIKIGVNAEFKAFEKMKRLDAKALFKQVRAQVPAGLKATAARRNCKFLLPNGRQIQALTKAKAAHWLKTKQFSMKNAKDVIKAFMKQRAAIHIKILTGKAKNAQSDMVPTAVIKGSDRTKTVKLKIKKTPGKWGTALVMAQGLGDFKKLTLKAGNMDGWLIQEVRVAQGKGRWLGMLAQSQRGFDLDSTSSSKWLDMKPFNKPAHYGLKKITGKKVSTTWSYVPNGKSFGSKGSLSPGKLDSQGRCDCTMKGLRSKGAACKCFGKSFGSKGSLSPGKLDSQGRCDCTMKGLRSKGAACKCFKA